MRVEPRIQVQSVRSLAACVAFVLIALSAAAAGPSLTSPFANPEWTLTDINGKSHQPWVAAETRAVVLVFIGTDCPISNYYQPTLRALQQEFTGPAVGWYFVHTDPQVTTARAQQHVKDFSITAPVCLDPQHVLAHAAGATKLPQAVVLMRDGRVAYLGRIDDTYVGYGKKRSQPSQRDLQSAVADVLAGRPVANPRTESVGCFIPFVRPAGQR
jgi:hypothetical protein